MANTDSTPATGSIRAKATVKQHRKTKSVSRPKAIKLSPAMIELRARENARKEHQAFMDNITCKNS